MRLWESIFSTDVKSLLGINILQLYILVQDLFHWSTFFVSVYNCTVLRGDLVVVKIVLPLLVMPVMSADVCQGLVTIYLNLYARDTVFFTVCIHVAPSNGLFFFSPTFFLLDVFQNMLVGYLWDLAIFRVCTL